MVFNSIYKYFCCCFIKEPSDPNNNYNTMNDTDVLVTSPISSSNSVHTKYSLSDDDPAVIYNQIY
jgi:hypothetical protein